MRTERAKKINLLWLIILFIANLASCVTPPGQSEAEHNQSELIRTQSQLVVSYLNQGKPSQALKELRRMMRPNPQIPEYQNLMGLVQLSLKNPKKATQHLQASFDLKPNIPVALNLSSAFIETGRFAKAQSLLTDMINQEEFTTYQYPERFHHNLGLIAEKLEKRRQAIEHYRAALIENPDFYQSLIRLGKLWLQSGNYGESIPLFQQARSLCKICWEPTESLSFAYIRSGRPHRAGRVLKEYLSQKNLPQRDRRRAISFIQKSKKQPRSR